MKRTKAMAIEVERVYDHKPQPTKTAFLVDRLSPRGIKKEALGIKTWIRQAGPSDDLRRWFGHDPDKWPEFKRRYFQELAQRPEAWMPLLEAVRRGPVILLFAAKDTEHNNAVALREYLVKAL